MKKFGFLALLGAFTAVANAQFANGTIAVVSFDGGASAPVATGMRVVLKDFSTSGTFLNSITTDTYISGTSTSEGALNWADDGTHSLWVGGYATTAASGQVGASTAARRIQGYDVTSNVMGTVTDFASTTLESTNIRSAVVVNGNLLVSGTGSAAISGTRFASGFVAGTTPGSTTLLSVSATGNTSNTRYSQVWGNTAYWSTGSAAISIYSNALSAAPGTQTDMIGTKPTGTWSPYDFTFTNDGVNDVMYVADDSASTANGGVLKFTKNVGGTYDFAYRIAVAGTSGLFGTAAGTRGIGIVGGKIYATTDTGKNILEITDGGSAAGSNVTVIATAGTNEVYRGLEVVPEPASFAILGLGLIGLVARRRRKN